MRATDAMDSQAVITLASGTYVLQTGAEVANQHGIIRMPVETVQDGIRGWVTRTAEAANGPVFFRREQFPKGGGKGSRSQGGTGGKRGFDDGKGKY